MWNNNIPVIKKLSIADYHCIMVSCYKQDMDRGYIIILHKLLERKEYELQTAFLLAQQGFKCILVDLYGHGEDGNKIPLKLDELVYLSVEKISEIINKISNKGSTISLIGVSLGALVCLCLASYNSKVSNIVSLLGSGRIKELSKRNSFNKFQKGFGEQYFQKTGLLCSEFFTKYDPYDNPEFLQSSRLLMINGNMDFTIPISLVRDTVSSLKTYSNNNSKQLNFKYLELPYRGHQCTPDIYEQSVRWLIDNTNFINS
ncbi:alpha/beta hydrolase [Cytobacillus kochii]|uniref:alpha/beta fold hydrolase n=1 Tax=Cytobacillus kochii TaxID=859143 RepID=UPI001CD69AA2|nr:alpha/beta fold hydrolase [Cytobacillus kochii]MCA1028651.1 alpha/beta hydrolase [Cytobacillus kochii]